MDIGNTLMTLARDPELCAWRERGVAIRIRPSLVIERIFIAKPYPWSPRFADLVATDWQFGTAEQFYKKYRPAEPEVQS